MSDRFEPCPWCQRRVQARVPAGGDGSVSVYDRHNDKDGRYCQGTRQPADYEERTTAKPSYAREDDHAG